MCLEFSQCVLIQETRRRFLLRCTVKDPWYRKIMTKSFIPEVRIEDSYPLIKFKLCSCVLGELRVLVFCTRDLRIIRIISLGIRTRHVNHGELYRTDGTDGVTAVKRGRDSLKWCPSGSVTLDYVEMFPISAGVAYWHSSLLRNTDLSWVERAVQSLHDLLNRSSARLSGRTHDAEVILWEIRSEMRNAMNPRRYVTIAPIVRPWDLDTMTRTAVSRSVLRERSDADPQDGRLMKNDGESMFVERQYLCL